MGFAPPSHWVFYLISSPIVGRVRYFYFFFLLNSEARKQDFLPREASVDLNPPEQTGNRPQ